MFPLFCGRRRRPVDDQTASLEEGLLHQRQGETEFDLVNLVGKLKNPLTPTSEKEKIIAELSGKKQVFDLCKILFPGNYTDNLQSEDCYFLGIALRLLHQLPTTDPDIRRIQAAFAKKIFELHMEKSMGQFFKFNSRADLMAFLCLSTQNEPFLNSIQPMAQRFFGALHNNTIEDYRPTFLRYAEMINVPDPESTMWQNRFNKIGEKFNIPRGTPPTLVSRAVSALFR